MSLEKFFVSRMNKIKSVLKPNNLPRLALMVIILILLYLLWKNYLKEGFESSSEDFNSHIGKDKKLVLFYADWCGHCKKIKPDWDAAATDINKDGTKMIKVNCGGGTDSDKEIMEKYSIDGYPTIIVFENGNATPYNGKRTKEDFIEAF